MSATNIDSKNNALQKGGTFIEKAKIRPSMVVKESIKLVENPPNNINLKKIPSHSSKACVESEDKSPKRSNSPSSRRVSTRRLSRMNSKVSSISKKKTGVKGKMDDFQK